MHQAHPGLFFAVLALAAVWICGFNTKSRGFFVLSYHFCRISTLSVLIWGASAGSGPAPVSVGVFYFTGELLKPSRSASTMCQAHQTGPEPTTLRSTLKKKIGCESHACLFRLLYTYVLYKYI